MWSELYSTHFQTLLTVALLQTVAVISPGPDFAIVTRNSVLHSRKVGLATALGIAAGVCIHISYLVCGMGFVVSKMVGLITAIKVIGCLYLLHLGWKGLRASKSGGKNSETRDMGAQQVVKISPRSAFVTGFLTNALNPKAILFLLSLFTVVIQPTTPRPILVASGLLIVAITIAWFVFVSISLSGVLKIYFLKLGHWIDRVTGGFLLFIGAKIAATVFD